MAFRFSTRRLLALTTLVAVLLGAVAIVRHFSQYVILIESLK